MEGSSQVLLDEVLVTKSYREDSNILVNFGDPGISGNPEG